MKISMAEERFFLPAVCIVGEKNQAEAAALEKKIRAPQILYNTRFYILHSYIASKKY
jgi:hypothetical protein